MGPRSVVQNHVSLSNEQQFLFPLYMGQGMAKIDSPMIYHARFTGTVGPLGLAFLTSLQSQSNYFNSDHNLLQSVVSILQV